MTGVVSEIEALPGHTELVEVYYIPFSSELYF